MIQGPVSPEDLALLRRFPNLVYMGETHVFDEGESGWPVYAVLFRTENGEYITYAIKIEEEEKALREESVYAELQTTDNALRPLLAKYRGRSEADDRGKVALAFELAHDSVSDAESLLKILKRCSETNDRQTLRYAAGYIRAVSSTIADWHLRHKAALKATDRHVRRPYEFFKIMLEERRIEDLPRRLRNYLPEWNQRASSVQLVGVGRKSLPNPLIYLQPAKWAQVTLNPCCPIGWVHHDLHSGNIICSTSDPKMLPQVIDAGGAVKQCVAYFDLAYLEFDIIQRMLDVTVEEHRREWIDLLEFCMRDVIPFGGRRQPRGYHPPSVWKLIKPIREQVKALQTTYHPKHHSVGWWVATVAVGLDFARKREGERSAHERIAGLLYAAFGLERLLENYGAFKPTGDGVFEVDWYADAPFGGGNGYVAVRAPRPVVVRDEALVQELTEAPRPAQPTTPLVRWVKDVSPTITSNTPKPPDSSDEPEPSDTSDTPEPSET